MSEAASFHEIANALHELGFSEAEIVRTELTARNFVRHGWSEDCARYAIERMKRRTEVIDEARRLFLRAAYCELLIKELVDQSPPRWRLIWKLFCLVVSARWRRARV